MHATPEPLQWVGVCRSESRDGELTEKVSPVIGKTWLKSRIRSWAPTIRASLVRAERKGGGIRHTYTTTYSARDASGNTTANSVTMEVLKR